MIGVQIQKPSFAKSMCFLLVEILREVNVWEICQRSETLRASGSVGCMKLVAGDC